MSDTLYYDIRKIMNYFKPYHYWNILQAQISIYRVCLYYSDSTYSRSLENSHDR